jgi:hypothetical protein
MKPNFALSLSYEGIELLQRTAGGWLSVGAVPFDRPDLDAAIESLRQRALALAPEGITTKLIVPDSEVRFATVLAPGPTDEARRYQIEAEIEGLTPYPLSDLAYDWSVEGDHAQVAIVARDTLREAEEFAAERGLNPVSFVALPGSGQFLGEPFFGQTGASAALVPGGMVQPDADAVRILGKAHAPAAAAPAKPAAPASANQAPASATSTSPPASKSAAEPAAAQPAATQPAVTPDAPRPGAPAQPPAPAQSATAAAPPAPPKPAAPAATVSPALPARALPTSAATPAPAESAEMPSALGDLVRRMGTAMRREQARQETAGAGSPPARTTDSAPPAVAASRSGASAASPVARSGSGGAATALASSFEAERDDPDPRPEAGAVVAFSSRRTAPPPAASQSASPQSSAPGGRLAILPRGGQGAGPGSKPGRGPGMSPDLAKRLKRNSRRAARQTLDKLGLLSAVRRMLGRAPSGASAAALTAGSTARAATMPASLAAALAARSGAEGAGPAAKAMPTNPAAPPAAVPWTPPASTEAPTARSATTVGPVDRGNLTEADALTLFGRRGMPQPEPLLPARVMMVLGATLLVLVAVAVWALYFNRSDTPTTIAQGVGIVSDPVAAPTSADAPIAPPAELPARTAALSEPVPQDVVPADPPPAETAALTEPDTVAPDVAADDAAIAADPDARLEELVREAVTEPQPAEVLDSLPAAEQAAAETAAEPVADPVATLAGAANPDSAQPVETLQPEVTAEASALRLAMPGRLTVPPVDEVQLASLTPPPPFDAVAAGAALPAPQAEPAPASQAEAPVAEAPVAEPEPEVTVTSGRPAVVPAPRPANIFAPPPVDQTQAAPAVAPTAEAAAPEAVVAEAAAQTPAPATTEAQATAPILADDTPRADPALANVRPEPRSARVRALGEALRVVPVETPATTDDGAQTDEQPGRLDQGSLVPDGSPSVTPLLATAAPPPGSSPAPRPGSLVPVALPAPETNAEVTAAVPAPAPVTLGAQAETAPDAETQLAGLPPGGVDLSTLRPQRRPTDLVPDATEAAPAPEQTDTAAAEAVARSLVPSARPRALAARVEAALEAERRRPATATAAAAAAPAAAVPAPAAAAAAPNIPSSASVQQSATQARAISTREANLIGVFGVPSNRRALVRMPNGQVVRLQVGDRFDGGQVSAIGESELRYVRGGRDQVLRIASRG